MKSIINAKIVAFLLLFLLYVNLFANNFVLSNDGLIDPRAVKKIEQIGNEVYSKLGINMYIYAKTTLGLKRGTSTKDKIKYIKKYEESIVKSLTKPYVLLTMDLKETHVNLIISSELKNTINKDKILDDYVIPLLVSKDKNSLYAKTSASMLNGYAAIADAIAQEKNIKLVTNIENSGKIVSVIWKIFVYTLVVIGILLYTYATLRRKK